MDSQVPSQTNSSDYYEEDDPVFLEALQTSVLPGDIAAEGSFNETSESSQELEPPPPSQPSLKRRRLEVYEERERERVALQQVKDDEEVYGASRFGDYGQYMRRKRAKLQIQNAELDGDDDIERIDTKSNIFQGLAIYINGYTDPSIQVLRELIVKNGGIFQPYLHAKGIVTHIITCSLTPAKIREWKHMKIVKPEWLVESDKAGVLLPWKDFIYNPNQRVEASQGAQSHQTSLESQASLGDPYSQEDSFNAIFIAEQVAVPPPDPKTPTKISPLQIKPDIPGEIPEYAVDKSNPHAQRVMANAEWRKAHTSIAPDFIEGYYKNSRLHHLSTWKAELRNLVQEAQERVENQGIGEIVGRIESEMSTSSDVAGGVERTSMRSAELPVKSPTKGKDKGKEKAVDNRVIMHCDFDSFFVSAGLVTRPHLKGKPVVVCHSQGEQGGASSTSSVASCSYEARAFGIKNGMSLQQTRKLCPGIITIPYEFEQYKKFSLQFYTILMSHADDLQAVSVDEALIDVSSVVTQSRNRSSQDPSIDPAKDLAETIRAQVRKATGCEVSIGISHNILLARVATRRAKPAGSYHLTPEHVEEVLAPLTISDLHGFGWAAKQKAQEKLGTVNLGDLRQKSKSVLCDALGRYTGETLYNALRGIDEKKLESDKPRKSVSCDINYGIRFENNEQAEAFIYQMGTEVARRLDEVGMVGRSITLKIMKRDPSAPVEPPKFMGHGACHLFNKQMALIGPAGRATSDARFIGEHAWRLLRSFNFDPKELRGIAIQIQKLESPSAQAPQAGQAMLPFQRLGQPQGATSSRPGTKLAPAVNPVIESLRRSASPTKPAVGDLDLPSFSQIDMEVYNALPTDVKQELEMEYKRRSESPFVAGNMGRASGCVSPTKKASIFPKKITVKAINYKKVASALRPRNRPTSMIAIRKDFLMSRGGKAGASKLSDAALKSMNIEPEVFRALPPNVQHEQLAMIRIIKEKGFIPEAPTQRKVLKAKKPKAIPPHLIYRAPPPKAKFVVPPTLHQQGKTKKEKLTFSETGDIMTTLENWVTAYRKWAPKPKDIEFFSKYLTKAVDGRAYSDVTVQRAIAVMKWWVVLLRRQWGGSEFYDPDDPVLGTPLDPVGHAWWQAFRQVKADMDAIARKKFGGRLSLR